MRKLFMIVLVLLTVLMASSVACAEAVTTPAPAPTRIPDLVAVPEGERRPVVTATPRPSDAPLPEDPFMSHVVELSRRIDLLAKSSVFRYNEWLDDELTAELTAGDHTNPVRAFVLDGAKLSEALFAGMDASVRPDLTRVELRRDLVSTVPGILLTNMENDKLQIITTLQRYKVFASDVTGSGLIVLLYEDAVPILLTWYSDCGAVSLSASFMPDEDLVNCHNAADISEWFASSGLPEVSFEEVWWK